MLTKVKGNDSLARDEKSRAIINTNSSALRQAKKAKQAIINRIEKEKILEKRIENLESKLELLLQDKDNA
ncbi:MAG: hypothetical protein R3230_00820 [Nitrosopumilaceae archaeon]|nr:hypothetical protein [Nitrosopumilaceae archaeon]